jgi:hypothetical protein
MHDLSARPACRTVRYHSAGEWAVLLSFRKLARLVVDNCGCRGTGSLNMQTSVYFDSLPSHGTVHCDFFSQFKRVSPV